MASEKDEDAAYWAHVEKTAREVEAWPAWQRASVAEVLRPVAADPHPVDLARDHKLPRAALLAALRKHGEHTPECAIWRRHEHDMTEGPCTCGWDAIHEAIGREGV